MLTNKTTFDEDFQQKLFDFFQDENNLIDNVLNEREKAILTMRLQYKHSYRIIGTSLGLSYQRVIVLYNKALHKLNNIYIAFIKNNYTMIHHNNYNVGNSIFIQSLKSLSNKSKSELLKNDINTLQELQRYRVKDLMMFTRIGKKTIDEIKAVFVEHNLKFSDT